MSGRLGTRFLAVVGGVAAERVVELVVARRHGAWARRHGGVEHGAGHYPVMVALHTGLLVGSLLEHGLRGRPTFRPVAALTVAACQGLRWWCIRSLGPYWNTRVVVVPGHELVVRGPYRWLPHPNYLAVVVEGAALPLAGGSRWTAVGFTVANGVLLRHRIAVEEEALRSVAGSSPTPSDGRP